MASGAVSMMRFPHPLSREDLVNEGNQELLKEKLGVEAEEIFVRIEREFFQRVEGYPQATLRRREDSNRILHDALERMHSMRALHGNLMRTAEIIADLYVEALLLIYSDRSGSR